MQYLSSSQILQISGQRAGDTSIWLVSENTFRYRVFINGFEDCQ